MSGGLILFCSLATHARRRFSQEEKKPAVPVSVSDEKSHVILEGQSISASVVLTDFVDAEAGPEHKSAEWKNPKEIEALTDCEGLMTTMLQSHLSLDPSANSTVHHSLFTGDPTVPHQDLAFYFGTPSTYAYPNL
jgi:hypothetical protein